MLLAKMAAAKKVYCLLFSRDWMSARTPCTHYLLSSWDFALSLFFSQRAEKAFQMKAIGSHISHFLFAKRGSERQTDRQTEMLLVVAELFWRRLIQSPSGKSRTLEALCFQSGRLLSPSILFPPPLFLPPHSPLLPPLVCSCCWICPLFRWLVAMLLSSLCSLALWWIVYGFPPSVLHFCIDGLGFEWALQLPRAPPIKTRPAPLLELKLKML